MWCLGCSTEASIVARFRGLFVHWPEIVTVASVLSPMADDGEIRPKYWKLDLCEWAIGGLWKAHFLLKSRNHRYLQDAMKRLASRDRRLWQKAGRFSVQMGFTCCQTPYYIGCRYGVEAQIWERASLGRWYPESHLERGKARMCASITSLYTYSS